MNSNAITELQFRKMMKNWLVMRAYYKMIDDNDTLRVAEQMDLLVAKFDAQVDDAMGPEFLQELHGITATSHFQNITEDFLRDNGQSKKDSKGAVLLMWREVIYSEMNAMRVVYVKEIKQKML